MSDMDFALVVKSDCEATQQSIGDKELGERATSGLLELLSGDGLLATLFVIPTDLEASGALYRHAAQDGHEVGLHVHPADQGYEEFLGIYGPEDQRRIVGEAADRFAQVMGARPGSVCIGYHSANDYTYPVLAELGFAQGNVSQPERILPECASVWAGATADIHYANACNRLLPGAVDFVELPATNDPESRMWGGKHPQDLRVELVDAKNHWYTMAKAVDRQIRDGAAVKYLLIGTHNLFGYDDPRDFRRETLEKMIAHARDIVASKDGRLRTATIEQLGVEYRSVCPIDRTAGPALKLDTRGRA